MGKQRIHKVRGITPPQTDKNNRQTNNSYSYRLFTIPMHAVRYRSDKYCATLDVSGGQLASMHQSS